MTITKLDAETLCESITTGNCFAMRFSSEQLHKLNCTVTKFFINFAVGALLVGVSTIAGFMNSIRCQGRKQRETLPPEFWVGGTPICDAPKTLAKN